MVTGTALAAVPSTSDARSEAAGVALELQVFADGDLVVSFSDGISDWFLKLRRAHAVGPQDDGGYFAGMRPAMKKTSTNSKGVSCLPGRRLTTRVTNTRNT
jgi:hypothetical protein